MALPLVILLVIVGFVFVGVGAYVVRNMFWSSQGVVIESKLYNAAQNGIEWGMSQIWEHKDQLESDRITSADELGDIQVKIDDYTPGTATGPLLASTESPAEVDSRVNVTVTFSIATMNSLPGPQPPDSLREFRQEPAPGGPAGR